jgi:hypothetical protein
MTFKTDNSTALTIRDDGDVGIGETSPLGKLHVKTSDTGGTVSGDADELVLEGSAESGLTILGTNSNRIFFGDASSPAIGWLRYFHNDNHLDFGVNDSERMRIRSNGTTSFNDSGSTNTKNDWAVKLFQSTNDSATNYMMAFANASDATMGSIRTNGTSSTSYNTSSDYRLKENEVAISDGITRLKQLKPYRFNFKAEPDTTVDGFFAHEVTPAVPEAITGTKDELEVWKDGEELPTGVSVGDDKLDDGGNTIPKHQEIDQSKLVPLLTSALQEAITKIEILEAKVEVLEN